jgi:hypothetical protein
MKNGNLTVQIQATAAIPRWAVVNSYGRQADSGDSESDNHILGVTDGAIADTTYGDVTYSGVLFNTDWNWNPGAAVYLNALTLSETPPPTGFTKQIGLALTKYSLFVNV